MKIKKVKIKKVIAYLIILEQYETTKYDDKLTIQQMIRHYKKLYEDSKRQQDELAKKLEEAQKSNTNKDVSGNNPDEKSDLDLVNELARSFM